MIRVGMIGAGGIARTHAGYLGAMEEVRVAAVIDPVADRAAALAGDCGARVYDRLDTLLDDVDAVYVCSPPMAHREQVEAAAAAGKQVYMFAWNDLGLIGTPQGEALLYREDGLFLPSTTMVDVGTRGRVGAGGHGLTATRRKLE